MNKKRIKLLIVIQGLGAGGAETQVGLLAPYIDREIFDVQVAYYHKDAQKIEHKDYIP